MKLSPQALTTEEVYRLWPAFNAHYRATAAYLATVVLIQRPRPMRANIRVQTRNILVQPLDRPLIEDISPGLVATGEQLLIIGRHFVGDSASDTVVAFDDGTSVAPGHLAGCRGARHHPADIARRHARRADRASYKLRFARRSASGSLRSNLASFMLLPTLVTPPATTQVGATPHANNQSAGRAARSARRC